MNDSQEISEKRMDEIVSALSGTHPTLSAADVLGEALKLPSEPYAELLRRLEIANNV